MIVLLSIIQTISSAGALISFLLAARGIQNSGNVAQVFLLEPYNLSDRVRRLRRWTLGCFAVLMITYPVSALIG